MDLQQTCTAGLNSSAERPLILAVDDDKEYLAILGYALSFFGYAHVSTLKGQAVLRLAQTHQPDLILLDLVMPDLSGVEVLQQLQQNVETANIPVVAVTALRRSKEREQLLQMGCRSFLQKPYSLNDLEDLLGQCFTPQRLAS